MLHIGGKTLCENCFEELSAEDTSCGACGYDSSIPDENTGALPIGAILHEKYIIGKMLGRGGFGITYLAFNKEKMCKAAVKEYFPDSLSYRLPGVTDVSSYTGDRQTHFAAGVEKFYEEARILSRFNGNDHIVNVLDFFYEHNTAYYVMEYIDGIDLKKYTALKGGRLPFNEVLDIAVPVMYALIIVHSMDILHRDISPDNIYLTHDGNIKLLDFGAARQVFSEQSSNLSVILKHGYTPIEQYRKHGRHGPWSDIYALGATMYYMLTGTPPEESVNRVEQDDLLMPTQLGIPIPASLEIVLRKMLAVKAEDRYQSVIELKEALKAVSTPGGSEFSHLRSKPERLRAQRAPISPSLKKILAISAGGAAAAVIIFLLISNIFFSGPKDVTDQKYVFSTSFFSVNCTYTGKWSSNAPNGEGKLTINQETENYWKKGTVLKGNFVNGLIQGEGVQTDADGSKYKGGFKDGLRSGYGEYSQADGTVFKGAFRRHYLNGAGEGNYENGDKYVGNFIDGRFHGRGVYTHADGRQFEGEYVEGTANGYGVFTFPDGIRYEGNYSNDLPNGKGAMFFTDGITYNGNFKDGDWDGEGVLTDADGTELARGTWVDGVFQGNNSEVFSQETVRNGIPKPTTAPARQTVTDEPHIYLTKICSIIGAYSGEWENGMPNGPGIFTITEDGQEGIYIWFKDDIYQGTFVNGLLEGEGSYTCVDGSKYTGSFRKGLFSGRGIFASADGYRYTGEFEDDTFNGYGIFETNEGLKYEGGFRDGTFNGEGTLWNENGEEVFSGTWTDGEPNY